MSAPAAIGPETPRSFRSHLRAAISASAAPYGYTLAVFSTGSICEQQLSKPGLYEVLLFVAGAALAFLLAELFAFGRPRVRLGSQSTPPHAAWGYAHLASAGLAILVSWALLQVVQTKAGWALAGFSVTVVYVAVSAAQSLLSEAAVQ